MSIDDLKIDNESGSTRNLAWDIVLYRCPMDIPILDQDTTKRLQGARHEELNL